MKTDITDAMVDACARHLCEVATADEEPGEWDRAEEAARDQLRAMARGALMAAAMATDPTPGQVTRACEAYAAAGGGVEGIRAALKAGRP